jgi:hypothetical protein
MAVSNRVGSMVSQAMLHRVAWTKRQLIADIELLGRLFV